MWIVVVVDAFLPVLYALSVLADMLAISDSCTRVYNFFTSVQRIKQHEGVMLNRAILQDWFKFSPLQADVA